MMQTTSESPFRASVCRLLPGAAALVLLLACAPAPPAAVNGGEPPAGSPAAANGGTEDTGGGTNTTGLPTEPGATLSDIAGHVAKVGDLGWALVPDADPGTRYAPDELGEEFHEDGLRVVFSGVLGELARGERRWGYPLHLTSIRRAPE
ncbi:MAG: hypothetical protein KDD11_06495 [Acidobacteria bacterium]|nr:hypothetical protein [Acidobacteriota bacterium]